MPRPRTYRGRKSQPGNAFLRACPADWSEQEVSELRRFERALQLAGVATDINFGRSDEGDPWCVICRMGSIEVLAHFARIDGTYVGNWDGWNYSRTGDCLNDVSAHILNRIPF